MIAYHIAYDLGVLYGWNITVFEGGWLLLARATASLFLLLTGASFAISTSRTPKGHLPFKQMRRFCIIGGGALAVSLATYIIDPYLFVRFGILHLIALSSLALLIFRPMKEWTIPLGIAIICGAQWIQPVRESSWIKLIAGWHTPTFASMDYFPLFPWFGIILIGYGAGHFAYVRKTSWHADMRFPMPSIIPWMSKHALFLYLAHQPVIIGLLWLLLGRPDFPG